MLVDDLCEISKRGGDDIVLANYLLDVFIIEPIFFRGSGVDVVIHDFAERVFFMHGFGKIEIAAIMAESVVVGINVLPSPILRGQFAIAWIAVGDVLSVGIAPIIGETGGVFCRSNMNGLKNVTGKGRN